MSLCFFLFNAYLVSGGLPIYKYMPYLKKPSPYRVNQILFFMPFQTKCDLSYLSKALMLLHHKYSSPVLIEQ